MTMFLLSVFAGVCLGLIGWGMLKPGRVCEFPFLMGATFAGFVLPQAVGLTWGQGHAPAGSDAALVMCILCAGMCYVGWAISDAPMAALRWEFDTDRLLIAGSGLSAIGAFFFYLISRLPEEMLEAGSHEGRVGWTGIAVAYLFFAHLLRYGFAIALLLYAKTGSKWALAILIFDCLAQVDMIVLRGRRGPTIEFFLMILCAFWFVQRRTLPRWVMLGALAAGTVAVFGAGAYRAAMYQDQAAGATIKHEVPWEELVKVDYVGVFLTYNQEESYEFRNLIYILNTTEEFDGGLSYYNEMIYSYVPAQVFGADFKKGLQFDLPGEVTDPHSPGGSTITGMGDSFQAFGWFGCLVFFVMAFLLRRLFEAAQTGSLAAQLIYMLIITGTLHTVTHHTKWFLTTGVHLTAFLIPCLLWARKRDS